MLICISPNPAIDRRVRLEGLSRGRINRASSVKPLPGGKAAHVAMAARALGEEVLWVGFLGGATGEELQGGLSELGIPTASVKTKAATRTNLEILERDGTVTEILEPGGHVSASELERFFSLCRDLFSECEPGTQIALSGSLPPGVPDDTYAELTRRAHSFGCFVLLDASGAALLNGLKANPDLVKPNSQEAGWATGKAVRDVDSAAEAARSIVGAGARSVAVSLGSQGLYWHGGDGTNSLFAKPPAVEVVSTVGCGDAALAGFAVARRMKLEARDAVKLSVACGSANCVAEFPGLISRREVEKLIGEVSITAIENAQNQYL
jgi:1-phosphofructokinase family hexose kinase